MRPTDKELRRLGVSFVAESAGISEFLLQSNAMKVVLAPNKSSRSVVVLQHVRVGSRHEGAGNTGYSHLLEHMLFKGTPTHNRQLGNSYDEYVKSLGNQMNATTWYDRTNYFARVPAHGLAGLLEHEADRLRNANITDSELKSEMPVVVKEFEIGENSPDQLLSKLMWAQAFTEHPYKIDTIGSRSEVMKVTAESLKEKLYDVYYYPNNVTLFIVGGFDVAEALEQVVRCYADIPPAPKRIPTPYTVEPRQAGERRFVINKPGDLVRLAIAYHVPEADHDDHFALEALNKLLGGTEASRLSRRLVDKGIAANAGSYMLATHDPGLLQITAAAAPGVKAKRIERIILREVEKFKTKLVSAKDLAGIKKLNRNGTLMSRANQMGFAMGLSENEAAADWRWGVTYDDKFEQVTREDIMRVAKQYLTADNRTVGYFLPNGQPLPAQDDGEQRKQAEISDEITSPTFEKTVIHPLPEAASSQTFAKQVQSVTLANGLKVLLLPTETEAAFGFSLWVNAGVSRAPTDKRLIARVTADMLTRGSAKFSKKRIQQLGSEMLVNFNWSSQALRSQLQTLVTPGDLPLFLDMLSDSLCAPKFAQSELDLLKTQLLAEMEEVEKDPGSRAAVALSQALYEPGNPYRYDDIPSSKAQLQSFTTADVQSFHGCYGPTGAVLSVVGKFDVEEMKKLIEAKLGAWKGGEAPNRQPLLSSISAAGRRLDIHIEGKDSINIVSGWPVAVSMASSDYAAAYLANKALGGDTMSSRLGFEIREKRGLTYGVYSNFADPLFGGALWQVGMATDRAKLQRSLMLIDRIIRVFQKDGIGDKELHIEKSTALNAFALSLDGNLDVAGALTKAEYAGVGLEYLDTFESKIRNATKEQVNEAIRKYFQADNLTTAVAGTLPEGTPAS